MTGSIQPGRRRLRTTSTLATKAPYSTQPATECRKTRPLPVSTPYVLTQWTAMGTDSAKTTHPVTRCPLRTPRVPEARPGSRPYMHSASTTARPNSAVPRRALSMTASAPWAPKRPVEYWGVWRTPVTQITTATATGRAAPTATAATRRGAR